MLSHALPHSLRVVILVIGDAQQGVAGLDRDLLLGGRLRRLPPRGLRGAGRQRLAKAAKLWLAMDEFTMDKRERRRYLHRLDSYLDLLEEAQVRGERELPEQVFARISGDVPGLRRGISIAESLELVFREQEGHLLGSGKSRAPYAPSRDGKGPTELARPELRKRRAQLLTQTIKKRLDGDVSLLLSRAHSGKAWAALGYRSWEEYVRREFGLSRRRSYELLDHAQVITAIKEAAGMCGIPHIRPYTAAQLKPHLQEFCEALRQSTRDLTSDAVGHVVDDFLGRWQTQFANARAVSRTTHSSLALPATSMEGPRDGLHWNERTAPLCGDLSELEAMIAWIADLPPLNLERVQELWLSEKTQLSTLPRALRWLNDLAELLAEARRPAMVDVRRVG